jgi:RNA polymerase sigma factor (sigma-70 family)
MTSAAMSKFGHHIRRFAGSHHLGDLTDRQLLERFVAEANEAAFALVVRRHGALVLRLSRRILRQEQDAEDVFQATFLLLARKAASVGWQESIAGWLFQAAYHLASKTKTQAARRNVREARMEDIPSPDAVAALPPWELRSILDEELSRLPEKYRVAVVLCHMEGKSRAQAACELGWKPGALKIRLHRARELLRSRLTRRGLALTSGLVSLALTEGGAAAAPPTRLVDDTVRAAAEFALGKELPAGLVSVEAVALAEGGAQMMATGKVKLMVALLMALCLGTVGRFLAHRGETAEPLGPVAAARAVDPAPPIDAARNDFHGDPLPVGARARLGTLQWVHDGAVLFMAYTPDGKHVLTETHEGSLRLWDAVAGAEVRRFIPKTPPNVGNDKRGPMVPAAALSPDGKTVALGDKAGAILLWELGTGKPLDSVSLTPARGITSLIFAPDSKSLMVKDDDCVLHHLELPSGKELRKFGQAAGRKGGIPLHDIAFSPDGKHVATSVLIFGQGLFADVLKRWEVATGKEVAAIKGPPGGIASLALAADGSIAAWGCPDGSILLHDIAASKELRRLPGAQQTFFVGQSVAFSPDGKVLASRPFGRSAITLWSVENGKELRKLPSQEIFDSMFGAFRMMGDRRGQMAFSSDGQHLLTTMGRNTVRQWEVKAGKEVRMVPRHHGDIRALAVSADGKTTVTHGADDKVRLWDAGAGKELGQIVLPDNVVAVAFSGNAQTAALAGPDGSVRVWDVKTAKELRQWKAHEHMWGFGFSPGGKLIASRSNAETIHLWDPATGKELRKISESLTPVESPGPLEEAFVRRGMARTDLIFSADDKLLASLVSRRPKGKQQKVVTVSVYDTARGTRRFAVEWNEELSAMDQARWIPGLPLVAFSPDSHTMAVYGPDQGITLYEVLSGQERFQIKSAGSLSVLSYSADGRNLVGGASDAVARFWDAVTGKELGQLKGHRGGVTALAFSADGRSIVSGSSDTTALVFDVPAWARAKPQAADLEAKQAEALWADLTGEAKKAHQAMAAMIAASKQVLPLLEKQLRPEPAPDARKIDQWIADLNSQEFAARRKAEKELEALGELAEPALQKVVTGQPPAEIRQRVEKLLDKINFQPPPDRLRALRAVEVLESMGTPEARQLLKRLAQGAPGSRLTRAAQGAVDRLARQGSTSR